MHGLFAGMAGMAGMTGMTGMIFLVQRLLRNIDGSPKGTVDPLGVSRGSTEYVPYI